MPPISKAIRRDAQRQNEPPRHRKMSRQAVKAARQQLQALKRRYATGETRVH